MLGFSFLRKLVCRHSVGDSSKLLGGSKKDAQDADVRLKELSLCFERIVWFFWLGCFWL